MKPYLIEQLPKENEITLDLNMSFNFIMTKVYTVQINNSTNIEKRFLTFEAPYG
jgi:hypothetical protein